MRAALRKISDAQESNQLLKNANVNSSARRQLHVVEPLSTLVSAGRNSSRFPKTSFSENMLNSDSSGDEDEGVYNNFLTLLLTMISRLGLFVVNSVTEIPIAKKQQFPSPVAECMKRKKNYGSHRNSSYTKILLFCSQPKQRAKRGIFG